MKTRTFQPAYVNHGYSKAEAFWVGGIFDAAMGVVAKPGSIELRYASRYLDRLQRLQKLTGGTINAQRGSWELRINRREDVWALLDALHTDKASTFKPHVVEAGLDFIEILESSKDVIDRTYGMNKVRQALDLPLKNF